MASSYELCFLTSFLLNREQLNNMDFQNIQILPNSPTQDGEDAVLSFFVELPDGTTMPSELLSIIYMSASPPVIAQDNALNVTSSPYVNPTLTPEHRVPLTVNGLSSGTSVCACFHFLKLYEIILLICFSEINGVTHHIHSRE